MATEGPQLEQLRQWVAKLKQLLKLRGEGGKAPTEALSRLREEMLSLGSGESSLPPGVQKLLGELSADPGAEPVPEDKEQHQRITDFREQLSALLEHLGPVLTPEEASLNEAWLQLSAQSLDLRRYELAMKALQDAWRKAKGIEAEKRVPAQPGDEPVAPPSPLKTLAEQALKVLDGLSTQLDELGGEQQVEFLLFASLAHKSMASGDHGVALGLIGEWYKLAEDIIAEQGRQRTVPLRERIERDVYIPNAELKTLEAPLAAVPHADDWFHRGTIAKGEWADALRGVEEDKATVANAVAQARLECQRLREQWAQDRQACDTLLLRLAPVASDQALERERPRLAQIVDGVDLAKLGLRALGRGHDALHELAQEWQRAAEAGEQARDRFGLLKSGLAKPLDRVSLEVPGERGALDLLAAAGQKLADQRDWVPALAKLEQCQQLAAEKIAAHRQLVKKGLGGRCEDGYVDALFEQFGASGVKKLADDLGVQALGDLSSQFPVGELVQLQAEAGDAKALKAVLGEVCGGKADGLKSLRAAFGSLKTLQALAKDCFDGKLKTVGTLLATGFGGDAARLKTFLDGFPAPDPEQLKQNKPAALKARQDQQNLKSLLGDGGLNDNPEVFAHLVKTGCDGDPAKLKELHGKFSATTPPGLAGMKALLDTAGLKLPPERLADILKTGCGGSAENLKELAIGFDGKMAQLKEVTALWGGDSGKAIRGLVDARHLQGDYQAIQKNFTARLNANYPGGGGNKATREKLIRKAPEFTRAVVPDNLNATLTNQLAPDPTLVGSFDGTDWNHLLMHACERHLPANFAFKGAKAAKKPINVSNTQFPPDWTPEDIGKLLQEALESTDGQQAIADSEAYADDAQAWYTRQAWEAVKWTHDRWLVKRNNYQAWQAHEHWYKNGGSRWRAYQRDKDVDGNWFDRRGNPQPKPRDPGPEPTRPKVGWDEAPGKEPARPGVEPPVVAEPVWDPQRFWHADVEFQIGVDFRAGKRQITQLFPVRSRPPGPAMTAFSEGEMLTLRDAMTK